jgi:hypothetical protein
VNFATTRASSFGKLLICNPLWDISIATQAPQVAIQEQMSCKRGQVSCAAPTLQTESNIRHMAGGESGFSEGDD